MNDECKIENKCREVHDWAHVCLRALKPKDLHQAHELGNKILNLLNEKEDINNAVKFIALFEALSVGTDVLDHDLLLYESDVIN